MVKVLLIDDEEMIIEYLTQLLQSHGYEVCSASKGDEALALIERCSEFDIIVSDIMMPDVSGLDLLNRAHKVCSIIPFIIITGFPNYESVAEAFKHGAYSYITKPIDKNHFLHLLDRAYEKKRLEVENLQYKNFLEEQVKERTAELSESLQTLQTTLVELELFHRCFEQSNDATVILDEFRKIREVNKAFERVTGYAKEEVIGKTMSVLRSDYFDKSFYQQIWEEAVSKGFWVGDIVNRKKDGSVYQTRFSLGSIKDADGNIKYYLGTFVEIDININL